MLEAQHASVQDPQFHFLMKSMHSGVRWTVTRFIAFSSDFTSWILSFLICKVGTIMPT